MCGAFAGAGDYMLLWERGEGGEGWDGGIRKMDGGRDG